MSQTPTTTRLRELARSAEDRASEPGISYADRQYHLDAKAACEELAGFRERLTAIIAEQREIDAAAREPQS